MYMKVFLSLSIIKFVPELAFIFSKVNFLDLTESDFLDSVKFDFFDLTDFTIVDKILILSLMPASLILCGIS